MLENFRVYAIAGDDTACGQYRILRPLRYLETLGLQYAWSTAVNPEEIEAFKPNIVLFQRQFSDEALNLMRRLKAKGIPCIFELDDNLHRILPNSPARVHYDKGTLAWTNTQTFIREVNGCTYSTPELATFYGLMNPNRIVVENCIDFALRDWDTPYDKPAVYASGKRLVLGWSGGAQHQDDIPVLKTVIPKILKKYSHVDFALYTNSQEALKYFDMYQVPNERRIIVQPQPFNSYPYHLGLFDIGLCPVKLEEFNLCKSSLKAMEYSARGVVTVASKIAPYVREIENGKTGFTADGDYEFEKAISTLIENPTLLKEIKQNAYDQVHERRDLGKNCMQWPQAWIQLVEGFNKGVSLNSVPEFQDLKVGRNDPCPCGSGLKYKKCCSPAYG